MIDLPGMNRVEVDARQRRGGPRRGRFASARSWTEPRTIRLGHDIRWLPDGRNCRPDARRGRRALDGISTALACDNLISAQLVTVDGRQVEASQKSNSDLFWAIRGGGGNFGVVTALEYQLHPVNEVLAGALMFSVGRLSELLQAFVRSLAEAAPDEMNVLAQLLPS